MSITSDSWLVSDESSPECSEAEDMDTSEEPEWSPDAADEQEVVDLVSSGAKPVRQHVQMPGTIKSQNALCFHGA